jgi:hypothetical protein
LFGGENQANCGHFEKKVGGVLFGGENHTGYRYFEEEVGGLGKYEKKCMAIESLCESSRRHGSQAF